MLSGTSLRMSFAYHPKTDDQTKVLNHIIEQCLRAFVHKKPSSRGKFLNWVEWSYNTSLHSSFGASPYEITFGKKPFNFPQYLAGTTNLDGVDDLLTNRESVFTKFKKKLLKAQAIMKQITDTKYKDVNFNEGDRVMVKLLPHCQSIVSRNHASYSKLAKRYYGPYQILECIGKAAHILNLPEVVVFTMYFIVPYSSHFIIPPGTPSLLCHYQPL